MRILSLSLALLLTGCSEPGPTEQAVDKMNASAETDRESQEVQTGAKQFVSELCNEVLTKRCNWSPESAQNEWRPELKKKPDPALIRKYAKGICKDSPAVAECSRYLN